MTYRIDDFSRETVALFWSKTTEDGECLIWSGAPNSSGYGTFRRGGIEEAAHRYAYRIVHGDIPSGLVIDHICHRPACVNPKHLRAITQKQNCENLSGAHINSKSGVRGVWKHSQVDQWVASLRHHGKRHYLGLFATIEQANDAVIKARRAAFTHSDMDNLPALNGEGK